MTEADWLANTSAKRLIRFLRRPLDDRKAMLFDVACCRRLRELLVDRRSDEAVAVLERLADAAASETQFAEAYRAASAAANSVNEDGRALGIFMPAYEPPLSRRQQHREAGSRHHAASAVVDATSRSEHLRETPPHLLGSSSVLMRSQNALCGDGPLAGPEADEDEFGVDASRRSESKCQADVARDIFANPFRPITLPPAHRSPTIVSLARAAYDERQLPSGELDPHRLAVLADAMEEVGAPGELVAHLRGPGPHVRGCHVVDLALGLS